MANIFKKDLGVDAPETTQKGESTANSKWWFYEGVNDPNANTPLNGTYLNRAPRSVMSSLISFANSVEAFLTKPFESDNIADSAITYDKLDDGVKTLLSGKSSTTTSVGSNVSVVEDTIRAFNSSTRISDI